MGCVVNQGSTATSVFTHVTTGIHCNSGIYTRYNRGPLHQQYLHTLQQGLTATAVFTHITKGVHCNSTVYTNYDRNPLQQRYLGLHTSRQGSTAKKLFTPVTRRITVEISEDITLRIGKLWVLCLLRLSIVLTQMVTPVVWMKVVVFRSYSMLPHNCSCSVAPWDHCCVLAFLKRRQNCRMCSGD